MVRLPEIEVCPIHSGAVMEVVACHYGWLATNGDFREIETGNHGFAIKKNAYQNQWEIYAMLPNGPCMEYPTFEQFVGQFNLQYSISGAFGAVQCRFHPIGM
jgi:hypothetical protein